MFARGKLSFVFFVFVTVVLGCGENENVGTFGRSKANSKQAEEIVKLHSLPNFEFLNQDGNKVSSEGMRGKVWAASFFFSSCPSVCPRLMGSIQTMRARPDWPKHLKMVSISVDPEVDTPAVLKNYGKQYDAEASKGWELWSGELGTLKKAVKEGFKVAVGEREKLEDGRYDVLHSTHFILVDQQGFVRGYFRDEDAGRDALLSTAKTLLSNAPRKITK